MTDDAPTLDEAAAAMAALVAYCRALDLPEPMLRDLLPQLEELRLSIERLASVTTEREDGP